MSCRAVSHASRWREISIYSLTFVALMIWAHFWPLTGAVDSVDHYLNARDASVSPTVALSPWARPLYKLLIVWPALHGIVFARVTQALITVALMWQTVQLAKDLRLERAWLAGLLLICQPLVFALGSDTMSELPFALGLTIVLRLWTHDRWSVAALVGGFLPMVRPEGFLIASLAGFLAICFAKPRFGAALGFVGLFSWAIACAIFAHNWHYFLDVWSWPAHGYASYGRGSLLHHVLRWPWYCGWVLFPLFVFGIAQSLQQNAIRLPLIIWVIIFLVHSILFWSGWFASIGEMRILATTAPITALICLHGWNRARAALPAKLFPVIALAASFWVCWEYTRHVAHYACFAADDVARYIRSNNLLQPNEKVLVGDKLVIALLDLPPGTKPLLDDVPDRAAAMRALAALPVGTIGEWDNRVAEFRFGVTIDELRELGFEILYESKFSVPDRPESLIGFGWTKELRYVVVRKRADHAASS